MSTWLTSPLETENPEGNLVLATVRKDVRKFIDNVLQADEGCDMRYM